MMRELIWPIEPRIPNQKCVKRLTAQSLFGGLLPERIEYPDAYSCFENFTWLRFDLIPAAYGKILTPYTAES